jgi:hypothetical protein
MTVYHLPERTIGFSQDNDFPIKTWTLTEAHKVLKTHFMVSMVGLFASQYVCYIIATNNTPFIPFCIGLTLSPP